jgi:SAM-dependent methyltransferase
MTAATQRSAARRGTMAERADRHTLYQVAVQTPATDIDFFERRFHELRGRDPLVLREDFCGTANLACQWVRGNSRRRAIGIDLDEATLAWGRANNLAGLRPAARRRVTLHRANVLDGVGDRADIACAMNFSYCVFKSRALLRRYFEAVHERLVDDGVFVCELYGGTEAIIELEEEREVDGFTYVWDQERYDLVTHETLCHIHFDFPDGSRLERAFTYDWRLWTIPELRELLAEAGFAEVQVWWETVDEDGDGTGEYGRVEHAENQEAWLVYLVAVK